MSYIFIFVGISTSRGLCDVALFGAKGLSDDSSPIQKALDGPKCDEVLFPPGKKFSSSALTLKGSNVVITFGAGSELTGTNIHGCDNEADWRGIFYFNFSFYLSSMRFWYLVIGKFYCKINTNSIIYYRKKGWCAFFTATFVFW